MRSRSLPHPDIPAIEAFAASLRVWFLEIAVGALDWFKPRSAMGRLVASALRRHLRGMQHQLKWAALALALTRLRAPPPRSAAPHPQGGYRLRRARGSDLRLFTSGVFRRMRPIDLRVRVARMRDLLENLDVWIDRLAARIMRGFTTASRVLAAPPPERAYCSAPIEVAAADSS